MFAPVLYIGYSLYTKSWSFVPHLEADLFSGSRDEEDNETPKAPKNIVQKFWAWLM